jgi:hypothetical protein
MNLSQKNTSEKKKHDHFGFLALFVCVQNENLELSGIRQTYLYKNCDEIMPVNHHTFHKKSIMILQ